MAVQNDTSRIQYNGNNSTVNAYAIPFPFFENSHIRAVVTTSAGVDSDLNLGTGFTLTGAGNPNGGSLVTVAAVPTTSKVTIFRNVPATQTTSYQEGGDFPAASHERALDKLTQIAQQTKRLADRALKVPESQSTNPPDIPNAGSGSKLLASESGALEWKDDRTLPPYPGSNSPQLLTAPGSGGAPAWQDPTTIAVGPVTSTGSIVARTIDNRFAEQINVMDYGAVGDGITDDWLAIQRAIKAATFGPQSLEAATMTLSDTQLYFGVQIPKLFLGQGGKKVFLPSGNYYISRPLLVNHGTQLYGATPDKTKLFINAYGNYNAIESFGVYYEREFWPHVTQAQFLSAQVNFEWNANLQIHNVAVNLAPHTFPTWSRSGTTITITFAEPHGWVAGDIVRAITPTEPIRFLVTPITSVPNATTIQITVQDTGATAGADYFKNLSREELYPCAWYPVRRYVSVASGGSSGSNTITFNKATNLSVEGRIRFSGGSDEYTITSISGSTVTVSSNFTRNVAASELVLFGYPAQNGIFVNGGENAMISQFYVQNLVGAGVIIYSGSPAPVISNCMVNGNSVGYWIEHTLGGYFIKPSGDNNYIMFKLGTNGHCGAVFILGLKAEYYGSNQGVFGTLGGGAYPDRCLIQAYADTIDGSVTIIGGTITVGGGLASNENRTFFEGYRVGGALIYNVIGLFEGSYGANFVTMRNKRTGALLYNKGRHDASEGPNVIGGKPLTIDGAVHSVWRDSDMSLRLRNAIQSNFMVSGGGIMGDAGTFTWYNVPFTISGTTMEFEVVNHGLVVGDYVRPFNLANLSPFITFDSNSQGDPAYSNSVFKVQSIVNADKFTITVTGGPSSGTVLLYGMKFWYFHQILGGAHVFQMPNQLSASGTDRSLFKLISRNSRTQLAGLNVPALDTGEWWAKDQLTIGGTCSAPAVRLATGTGAPTSNLPDGSLYLRTDGDASTTLYARAAGAWKPLASYDP